MALISWSWYKTNYSEVPKGDFERIVNQAERIVSVKTHGRSCTATDYKAERVKECIANVINTIYKQEQTGAGNGVKSVSNDGYAETYETATKEQADREIHTVCLNWLSGTGLMGAL